MMDCGTFLDGYSDLRDGLLPEPARVAFEAHLRGCASCARYDRVVADGVRILGSGPPLEVSEDFMDRLRHRLYHVDDEIAARARPGPARGRAALGVAAAAVVAGFALLPGLTLRARPTVTMLPGVVAAAPPAAGSARVAVAPAEGGDAGLTARLEEVGVRVLPLPYRDVVHHSASRVTLAAYATGE